MLGSQRGGAQLPAGEAGSSDRRAVAARVAGAKAATPTTSRAVVWPCILVRRGRRRPTSSASKGVGRVRGGGRPPGRGYRSARISADHAAGVRALSEKGHADVAAVVCTWPCLRRAGIDGGDVSYRRCERCCRSIVDATRPQRVYLGCVGTSVPSNCDHAFSLRARPGQGRRAGRKLPHFCNEFEVAGGCA